LTARIETGVSTLPRRHARSQGAPQMRPQIDTKGFVARAMAYASRSRPSATAVT
jgi:hypothetical protein